MNKYAVENLFGIDGFNIAWYGVIIAIGMMMGIFLAMHRARKYNINSDCVIDFVLIAIPISIACARLYYVVFEWDSYKDNLLKIFAVREGGLAIFGGVIGGVITALIFCKFRKINFWEFADVAVPSLLLGQIVGRWGNFINQEAYGNLILDERYQKFPFAVYIQELAEWHQATFFYESFLNTLLLIVMLGIERRFKFNGKLLCLYLIGYGFIRFLIEGLRTDSLYILPGIRVSQMLALILIPIGIMLWIVLWTSERRTHEQENI